MALISVRIERPGKAVGNASSNDGSEEVHGKRRGRRLLAGAVALAAVVGGVLVNTSVARASIVSIPPQTIANHVSVAGQGLVQLVVSGGSTTVPTDATRVVFGVTISGTTASGNVAANPTGAAGSGAFIHYTAGTTATGTLTEQVGRSNQVAFHNGGTNGITLTVQITGYSTEVRASDIAPTGGSTGQVLTNTGAGAAWQSVGHAYGTTNPFSVQSLNTGLTTVSSVTVPSGSYVVTFSTTIAGSTSATPDNTGCYLFSPAGSELNAAYGNTYGTDDQSVITMQGLVSNTAGGAVTAQCVDTDATASVFYPTLIANSVGGVDGYSGNGAARLHHIPSGATALHR